MFKRILFIMLLMLILKNTFAYDVLLEVKGGAFISTNDHFKQTFGQTAGTGGGEITFNAWDQCDCWKWLSCAYGFVSADYIRKRGKSLDLCNFSAADITTVGLGVKFLLPYYWGDIYLGIGALPTHLKIQNCFATIRQNSSDWSCGGVFKFGAFVDLPCSLILDFFLDYQFVSIEPNWCLNTGIAFNQLHVSGAMAGVGLGYRFN